MGELSLEQISRNIVDPSADLIFVHGLGGNAKDTWTPEIKVGKGENEKEFVSHFPSVLAADFPECGVWSLQYPSYITNWGKNARFDELPRLSIGILNYLNGKEIGKRPIIFICHSLGGIVVKELMRVSESSPQRLKSIYNQTKAISFIATPHKGSQWATILNDVNRFMPFVRTSDSIEEIEHDNAYLEQLSHWYRQKSASSNIETQAFYERKKTKGIMVVPHYSANPDVSDCLPVGINRNHIEISRPTKKSDDLYVSLCGMIRHHVRGDQHNPGFETPENSIPPQTIVIGIVIHNDKVLMVRRRNPIDNLTWQFVAGRLKVGQESEEDCIEREVMEETNITAKVNKKIGERMDGSVPYKRIYYALNYLDGKERNVDKVENSDVKWVQKHKVDSFVTSKIDIKVREYIGI